MACTGKPNTNELNSIFKALAETGKEGALHREYNENHAFVLLKVLSSQLNKTGNRVIVQAYGSAAEDLKCYERHDLGDMDIMVFPNSDNLIIHDELLEYSAENPLHVRIKGCDNPALRSCLVEDTGYVATSALKNFHPAIFGSKAPHIVNIITRVFETFLREEFSSIVTGGLSNHSKSPAATFNLSRVLAITPEQREILQDQASNFPFSLCAVDVEWITSMICSYKGIDYTRQHAELMKYIMSKIDPISHFQKLSIFPRENTDSDEKNGNGRTCIASQTRSETECCATIEKKDEDREKDVLNYSFPSVPSKDGSYAVIATQSCANWDGNQSPTEDLQSTSSRFTAASPSLEVSVQLFPKPTGKVGTTIEAMEKHSEEDVKKNGYRFDSDENESTIARLSSTQEKEVNSKAPPGGSDCTKEEDGQRELEKRTRRKRWVNYLLGREAETKRTPILRKENYHQSLKQPSPKEQTGGEGLQGNSHGEGEKNGNAINDKNGPNGEGQQMTKTGKESSKALAHNCNSQEDALQQEGERRIQHRLIQRMFGTAKEGQTQQAKVKDTERVQSGIDFIPALRSREWPKVAREWIKRERKWPSPDIVENIIHEGYHLVVKSPKKNGDPDCDFRISFSHAEYLLSQEMNDIQRDCYRCFKKYHRAYLCTQPKSLVSFHLKNLFLQTIEETGAEMWTESNRAECMIKLLGNLLNVLKRKDLRHFFVKSYNLFGVDYVENPDVLESLAGKVLEIMEDPKRFATQMIQSQAKPREKKIRISQENVPSEPIECEQQMKSKKGSSKSIHDTKKSKKSAAIFPPSRVIQGRGLIQECQYHDLKDLYLDVTKELLYMAFDDADCRLEAVEPLERSVVQDLRELVRNEGFPVEEVPGVLETFWQMGYPRVRLSTEPDMRRRMLVEIQSQIEMLKYILQQDDIEVGNEEAVEAVVNRMLDPSAKNAFDLSHIIPSDIVTQFVRSVLAECFVPKPDEPNLDDDIPLD